MDEKQSRRLFVRVFLWIGTLLLPCAVHTPFYQYYWMMSAPVWLYIVGIIHRVGDTGLHIFPLGPDVFMVFRYFIVAFPLLCSAFLVDRVLSSKRVSNSSMSGFYCITLFWMIFTIIFGMPTERYFHLFIMPIPAASLMHYLLLRKYSQ